MRIRIPTLEKSIEISCFEKLDVFLGGAGGFSSILKALGFEEA